MGGFERTVDVQSDSKTEVLVKGGIIIPFQAPARNTTYRYFSTCKHCITLQVFMFTGGKHASILRTPTVSDIS